MGNVHEQSGRKLMQLILLLLLLCKLRIELERTQSILTLRFHNKGFKRVTVAQSLLQNKAVGFEEHGHTHTHVV